MTKGASGPAATVTSKPVATTLRAVRRLVVTNQHLSGKWPPPASPRTILSVVRDLTHVQWDPISIVAPSHILSLWNRVGDFRIADLEKLLWEEKKLFLHWTPVASIVLTEDYPLYLSLMRRYPESMSHSWGAQRAAARKFLASHSALRRKILSELRSGPLRLGDFKDHSRTQRKKGDWDFGSDVSHMMYYLLMCGEVMVVGHDGNQNLWGLSESFLPSWVDRKPLSQDAEERTAALRAIHALGTATPKEITYYFPRGRYDNLRTTLAGLEGEGAIRRVAVDGLGPRDERYVHVDDIPRLERIDTADWSPRVALLPPFDNMIGSTDRTRKLFGFEYIREQFFPKEKRKFGTYVLPILWGDTFVGRIDARMDKAHGRFELLAVHAEPKAPADREVADAIGETISRLGAFLGATQVTYTAHVPDIWKRSLR